VVTELYIKTLEQVQHTMELDAESKSFIHEGHVWDVSWPEQLVSLRVLYFLFYSILYLHPIDQ